MSLLRWQVASEFDVDIMSRVYSLYVHLFSDRLHIIVDYRIVHDDEQHEGE